jgi:hypothetical protein
MWKVQKSNKQVDIQIEHTVTFTEVWQNFLSLYTWVQLDMFWEARVIRAGWGAMLQSFQRHYGPGVYSASNRI